MADRTCKSPSTRASVPSSRALPQILRAVGGALLLLFASQPAISGPPPDNAPGGPEDEVHRLVDADDLAGLRSLLERSPRLVDARDRSNNTPLIRAAARGNAEICRDLLERGADVRVVNKHRQTPLHGAALAASGPIVEMLLARNVEINARDDRHATPLYWAARAGAGRVVALLLDHGADPNGGIGKDESPLDYVARFGFRDLTDSLISAGADVNFRDVNGATPLFWVARGGLTLQEEAVLFHLHGEAAPDYSGPGDFVSVAELLIGHGAEVNAQSSHRNGLQTPLHAAAEAGRADVAAVLLKHGAKLDSRNTDGETPLHVAANCGQVQCTALLLDRGAEVDAVGVRSPTPLGLAILGRGAKSMQMRRDVVALLIRHGADVNRAGFETPLAAAAGTGDSAMVGLLLRAGADPHVPKGHGRTALQVAMSWKYEDIARMLREHGATR